MVTLQTADSAGVVLVRERHFLFFLLFVEDFFFCGILVYKLKAGFFRHFTVYFIFIYALNIKKPCIDEDDPHDAVRNKLKRYNLLLSYCNPGGASCEKIKQEKERWLKSLHLEEDKIL